MKKIAFLEYAFLFDPEASWGNVYEFENDLGKFFKVLGYNAQVVDAVRGFTGRRIIYITKITDMLDDPKKAYRKEPVKAK